MQSASMYSKDVKGAMQWYERYLPYFATMKYQKETQSFISGIQNCINNLSYIRYDYNTSCMLIRTVAFTNRI